MSNLKLPKMTIAGLKRFKYGATIAYKTTIEWNADKTKCGIYHHNSLIAVIDESGTRGHKRIISVSSAGYASKTTIHRLRVILHENTNGYYGARIKDYTAYITCSQSHYTGGFMHEFSGRRFYSVIVNDYPTGILGINGRDEMLEGVSNLITYESIYDGIH